MTGFRTEPYVGGLSGTEAQVMELWDRGATMQRIAKATGLQRDRVKQIVSLYHIGPDDSAQDARAGTAALLAAIHRHHSPERMSA